MSNRDEVAELLERCLTALDLAQAITERSAHHPQILGAYNDLRKALASLQSDERVEEVEEAYADASNTINAIYGASQFCDCPSFGLAQKWREDTHGGEMISAKRIVQPTGSET